MTEYSVIFSESVKLNLSVYEKKILKMIIRSLFYIKLGILENKSFNYGIYIKEFMNSPVSLLDVKNMAFQKHTFSEQTKAQQGTEIYSVVVYAK